ncbi:MAG: YciI family protein [Actinobacteria bacterium]|nr:YciI family protein [Actinomycetota bacterium]
MQFLLSVIDHQTGLATEAEMADIGAFNDRLRANGHLIYAGGLEPPGSAAVFDNRGSQLQVSPGAHEHSAEYLSGFWLVTAPDRDVARALAAEASRACNRRVELRTLLGG